MAKTWKRLIIGLCLAAGVSTVGGCTFFTHRIFGHRQPYVTATRLQRGLIIVLPGIEGRSSLNQAICDGLNDGGVNQAIELYDWTSSLGMLANLRASSRNHGQARDLALRIVRYQTAYRDRPVVLVAQSGGAAIAAWTAEALPRGAKVDGIIMIAPSLSPDYDLALALSNSRRGIVTFHSSKDWLLLGVGTTIVGTMDGEHTQSAGRVGFVEPEDGGHTKAYRKLFQVAWQKQMSDKGFTGSHLSSGAREFVSTFLAPLVKRETWSEEAVDRIVKEEVEEPTPVAPAPSAPSRSKSARRPADKTPAKAPGENGSLQPPVIDMTP